MSGTGSRPRQRITVSIGFHPTPYVAGLVNLLTDHTGERITALLSRLVREEAERQGLLAVAERVQVHDANVP